MPNKSNKEKKPLSFDDLKSAVSGSAAAIRIVTRLEPVGHPQDKVFPPTYLGGEYAFEKRYSAIPSEREDVCAVLLHSVAGQANLMEEALKSALGETPNCKSKPFKIPLLKVNFEETDAAEFVTEPVTVLDTPHRVFDAIFRDSCVPGSNGCSETIFRDTCVGKDLARASLANATPLFEWSPTSIVFGCWNSSDDKIPEKIGGTAKKLKYARVIVSEIVGYEPVPGVRVGGKDDVIGITGQTIYRLPSSEVTTDKKKAAHDAEGKVWYRKGGDNLEWTQNESEAEKRQEEKGLPVYRAIGWEWTADLKKAARDKQGKAVKWGDERKPSKKGKPSNLLLGQIPPKIGKTEGENNRERKNLSPESQKRLMQAGGGVTMKYALQTTVLSLSALRRLRFPVNKGGSTDEQKKICPQECDIVARTVLAALGLVAITAQKKRDYFLRSRCELRAVESPLFEFVVQGRGTQDKDKFSLDFAQAVELLHSALEEAGQKGLKWKTDGDMPNLKPQSNLAELIRLSHEQGGAEDDDLETS